MSRKSHKNGKGIVTVFLMVLALIFVFSFIGCANGTASAALDDGDGNGTGGGNGGGNGQLPQIPPGQTATQWANSLQSTLGDEVATVAGTTVTLIADVTITEKGTSGLASYLAADVSVPGFAIHSGGTLVVLKGKTLTVASGGALNTIGKLQLEGDDTEDKGGKLVVSGGTTAVTGSGTIEAAKNAAVTVSGGALTVAPQAKVTQAESSKIEVSSGSLAVQGTVQGAGTDDKVNIKVTGGSLSVASTAVITGKEVAIEAGGTSATIQGTITGTDKVDVKVSVENATVAATIESKEVVVTAAAEGVVVSGTVKADKVELAQEGNGTLTVNEAADLTVKEEIKLTSGDEGKPIEINTEVKAPEGEQEAPKVVADVPPTGSGAESLTFDADEINGATKGYLVKNVKETKTSYYIFVTPVQDKESHYKGPLSGTAAEIAAKLDEANPGNLGYFDLRVTSASALVTDTEGVVLVSSRIAAGTSVSERNVVTIPSFDSGNSFANGAALAAAVPVYIEDYAESAYESEYGENSTIEVQGGAFVFIPYRDTADYAKDYGKQNYKGIVLVKAGGALLDQGGAGFSIGPAGYWFDYNSIALIQSYASWNGPSDYNAFKLYVGTGAGGGNTDTNGLWIAPNGFQLGVLTVKTAYGVWDASNDVAQVNGSGSFVWVAGSTFGVNGSLTIARDFALSQDLKILPNSKVTVAGNLMLGYETGISDHSIVPIALSAAELAPLGLSGGATGGQQLVLNQGKAIVTHEYKSNSPQEKVVAVGTEPSTTYVPDSSASGEYEGVFPWKTE